LGPVEKDRIRALWFSELNLAEYVLKLEAEGIANVHFDYVDWVVWRFRTHPGRVEFWHSVRNDWRGSDEIYRRIEEAP
jgi:hypothetical protein